MPRKKTDPGAAPAPNETPKRGPGRPRKNPPKPKPRFQAKCPRCSAKADVYCTHRYRFGTKRWIRCPKCGFNWHKEYPKPREA